MRFEAVIFDLDGTLLDSMDVWEKIDICYLQKRELPFRQTKISCCCNRSAPRAG